MWLTHLRRIGKNGGRSLKMASMGDIPRELVALFEPQVEQLGIQLERQGSIWTGTAADGVADGTMWLCTPVPGCLILCHDVSPRRDMRLFEGSLGPYACACTLGVDAITCSRDCGLPVRVIGHEIPKRKAQDEIATFVEPLPRSLSSHLLAGRSYRSRSIIMLPDFFDDLDCRYPGEFGNLFAAFGKTWSRAGARAIRQALDAVPERAPLKSGGELGLFSIVAALMSSLAEDAQAGDGDHAMTLESCAQELISTAVEAGCAPPSVDELAKELYVSRSRLCEAFKLEIGQSVGAYGRQLRLERACRLLEDERLSIAEVAGLTGYPSISAFCHAFTSATGMSPRAWRETRRSAT